MTETIVGDIYSTLKARVVGFGIRPGERLNEVALARDLNVSRTPLREALNRLVSERLITFRPGAGFYCRPLEAKTIYDLYELRQTLEVTSVMMACNRAEAPELAEFAREMRETGLDVTGMTVAEAVERDEAFHIGIARLTDNAEMVHALARINDRVRFIRWVNMSARVRASKDEHRRILDAIERHDGDKAADLMSDHISRRMDQVVAAVKEGISNIYMSGAEELMGRVL